MHKPSIGQDRIRSHNLLSVDSAEGGEQTKFLNKHDIAVNHDQVSDVKHVCGENEDKLGGLTTINIPACMHTQHKGTYRFEKNLSRMTRYEGETEDYRGQKHERWQGIDVM